MHSRYKLIRRSSSIRMIPPDGGWGWMVVLGAAIANAFNQTMLSLISLMYDDKLEELGQSTQGAALVHNTLLFVMNFGGPISGVFLKYTFPRNVALTGVIFSSTGILLSGYSTALWHLVITYGVLLGIGLGLLQSSTFVSVNSYFKKHRKRAVGLATTGTSLGQMLMPHVVDYLLEMYSFKGTCLIMAGLSLNGIAGCLLLHPVEWHMIPEAEETECLLTIEEKPAISRKKSTDNILEVSIKDRTMPVLRKIVKIFDLQLLTSFRFLNIIFGIALAVTSIHNFTLIFPLFLEHDVRASDEEIAMCMSAVAGADILGRLTVPSLADYFQLQSRTILVLTCLWMIFTRQVLAYQTSVTALFILAALYGFGRSMVVVTRNIAVTENCTLEQVPSAMGLGMLVMSIVVPPVGLLLGRLRDYTQSYIICLTAQNMLMFMLVVTWVPDMLYLWLTEKKSARTVRHW